MKYVRFDVQMKSPEYPDGPLVGWETIDKKDDLKSALTMRHNLEPMYGADNVRVRKVTITEVYETIPPRQKWLPLKDTGLPRGCYSDGRGNSVMVES